MDESFNAKITDFGESSFEKRLPYRSSGPSNSLGSRPLSLFTATQSNKTRSSHRLSSSRPSGGEEPVGTPGWAAPEAIEGRAVRPSDVFSFGTMLWEVLTWRPPSVLVTIGMLREEPLCRLPIVIEAVYEYACSKAGLNVLSGSVNDDSEYDNEMVNIQSNHGTAERLSYEQNVIRERKKASSNKERYQDPTSSPFNSAKKIPFASVFSKFGSGNVSAPSTIGNASVAEMTANMLPEEKILVEVADMEFAYQVMCVRGIRPPIPFEIPQALEELLQSCWEHEKINRPSFPQILTALDKYFRQSTESLNLPLDLRNEINYTSGGGVQVEDV